MTHRSSRQAPWPSAEASQLSPTPVGPTTSKLPWASIDSPSTSFWTARARDRGGFGNRHLDARLLAQFGDVQPRREALILAPGRPAIEQKPEPFVMAEPVGLTVGDDFDEGLGHSMQVRAQS